MKKYIILQITLIWAFFSAFTPAQQKPADEYKYLKEVNGVRVYYSIKSYSPKPGKAAKKVVFKLKNATKTPKSVSFKAKVTAEEGGVSNISVTTCLKPNEENLKQELMTDFKAVKNVEISAEKATDGGC
jgi:hypothetical protein